MKAVKFSKKVRAILVSDPELACSEYVELPT